MNWRALAVLGLALASAAHAAELAPARAAALTHMLHQECGACHGLRLTGGLGSPLTATALADKPANSLVATILDGRPGSAMPPWRPFVSADEARWLVEQLQQGRLP